MSKSVLIIGGGVVGLCAAYYARQRGYSVTVVERGAPDHDCCSLGNAGLVVPSHLVPLAAPGMVGLGLRMMLNPEGPFLIRPRLSRDLLSWSLKFCQAANAGHVERAAPLLRDLNLASRSCYEEFAALWDNDFGLVKNGLLMLCKTEQTLVQEHKLAALATRLGLAAEALTPAATAKLDPNLQMDIIGSVFFAQDSYLTPQNFMARLTRALQENGVEFQWSTEVTGWKTRHERLEAVKTSGGELAADEYVLAGGAWSPCIVRDLRLNLPLQAGKGYNITLDNPKRLPALCSILVEARVAVTPMGSSLRFAGTMELAGLEQSINPRRVQGIMKSIPQYFPEFGPDDFQDAPAWSGLRPCSPDGLPYVGRFRRYPNLLAATGHAMMGMSLGPITGKLIAQLMAGEPSEIALAALSPDRYA